MSKEFKIRKIRRKWNINPEQKIKCSKKIYKRSKAKKEHDEEVMSYSEIK